MDVTFRQFKSFLTVARCGSFTQAAKLLHLSQPALTAQIKQLETSLELRLFDRNTHYVRLTRAGTSFVPVVQKIVEEFETVIAAARRVRMVQPEVIRFACFPSFAATILPNAIATFRKDHPNASFVLKDTAARRVIAMIRSGEVDCGISDNDPSATDLECIPLLEEEMHVVYPHDHPIGQMRRLTLKAVLQNPLVLLDADSNVRMLVDAAIAGAGHFTIPAGEAAYMSSAIGMVEAGLGITILPSLAIRLGSHRNLRSRRIDDTPFIRPISLIVKRGTVLSFSVQAFIDVLISESARYNLGKIGRK